MGSFKLPVLLTSVRTKGAGRSAGRLAYRNMKLVHKVLVWNTVNMGGMFSLSIQREGEVSSNKHRL